MKTTKRIEKIPVKNPAITITQIDSTNLSISEDQLKSELLALPYVKNVKLTKYLL
ncbi:MAG: hypothetical protein ACFFFH_17585 [Candidatus Thorarchaeota archaeon]